MNAKRDSWLGATASVLAHGGLILAMGASAGAASPAMPPPSETFFEVAPPPPPEELPSPVPSREEAVEETPMPRARRTPRVRRESNPAPNDALPDDTPPDDALPEPLALGGVTLTGQGSWSAGSGGGPPTPGSSGRRGGALAAMESTPVPQGTRLVRLENLSRPPRQPSSLAASLDRLYPPGARQRGERGSARVRLRISADGSARPLSLIAASTPEFGQACRTLLRASRGWRPGRDAEGNAVDTVIEFPCTFEVRP